MFTKYKNKHAWHTSMIRNLFCFDLQENYSIFKYHHPASSFATNQASSVCGCVLMILLARIIDILNGNTLNNPISTELCHCNCIVFLWGLPGDVTVCWLGSVYFIIFIKISFKKLFEMIKVA